MIVNGGMRRFQVTAFGNPIVVFADRVKMGANGSTALIVSGAHGDIVVCVVSAACMVVDLLLVEGAEPASEPRASDAKRRAPARLVEHSPKS